MAMKKDKEEFDTRATAAFAQYKPFHSVIIALRSLESKEKSNNRANVLPLFNEFVSSVSEKFNSSPCDPSIIRDLIKRIEQKIPTFDIIFIEGDYMCYKYKYLPDILFIKMNFAVINKDLQTSNELRQGNITKIPITVYVSIENGSKVLYTSVNGYRNEKDIQKWSNPSATNYYPANMFNSNLDDSKMFGGYALLTPDTETLKKFCKQRRDELNNYSYCKLLKVDEYGNKKYTYDQTVDEIQCVANGGQIVRTNTPKFGLLFDNFDAITEKINGDVEINDMYISESDPCADLSIDTTVYDDFNKMFENERKHNKVVTNFLK